MKPNSNYTPNAAIVNYWEPGWRGFIGQPVITVCSSDLTPEFWEYLIIKTRRTSLWQVGDYNPDSDTWTCHDRMPSSYPLSGGVTPKEEHPEHPEEEYFKSTIISLEHFNWFVKWEPLINELGEVAP